MHHSALLKLLALAAAAAPALAHPVLDQGVALAARDAAGSAMVLDARQLTGLSKLPKTLNPFKAVANKIRRPRDLDEEADEFADEEADEEAEEYATLDARQLTGLSKLPKTLNPFKAVANKIRRPRDLDEEADEFADEEADEEAEEYATLDARQLTGLSKLPTTLNPLKALRNKLHKPRSVDEEADEEADEFAEEEADESAVLEARQLTGLSKLPTTLNPLKALRNKLHKPRSVDEEAEENADEFAEEEAEEEADEEADESAVLEARQLTGLSKLPTTLNPLKALKNKLRKPRSVEEEAEETAEETADEFAEEEADEEADESAVLEARQLTGLSKLPTTLNPLKALRNKLHKPRSIEEEAEETADEEADEEAEEEADEEAVLEARALPGYHIPKMFRGKFPNLPKREIDEFAEEFADEEATI